mmetsp:Transcript_14404/g.39329  ORF Transcript_14404/g.39329 Transcript_14404/m.39329 type:complete len:482 (-) Transcript_14404:320-1765(-)
MYPMNCSTPRAGSVSPSNGNRWGHSAQAPACQQMPPARTADNGIEAMAKSDPFLSPAKQQVRQSRSGLDKGDTATYAESCEFVSLGCFCAVAHALQALGLKKFTYPFDWNRTPIEGIIKCVDSEFADFLNYGFVRNEGHKGTLFGRTSWGGSFWHHDITKQKTKDDFARRIERFYGRKEVPSTKPRVFVRAVNSSKEVLQSFRLLEALRAALPNSKIRLLMLVDMQTTLGLMRVAGPDSADIMFGRIHESLFAHDSRDWTIEQHSTAYSDAIAAAVRVWAGRSGAAKKVKEVADFDELMINFEHFDGGCCADNLFTPKRVPRPLACAKKTPKPAKSGRNLQPNPAPCCTPSCSSLGSVRSGTSSPSASPTRGRTRPALSSVDSTSSFGSGNQVKGAPNLCTQRARLDSSPCARSQSIGRSLTSPGSAWGCPGSASPTAKGSPGLIPASALRGASPAGIPFPHDGTRTPRSPAPAIRPVGFF